MKRYFMATAIVWGLAIPVSAFQRPLDGVVFKGKGNAVTHGEDPACNIHTRDGRRINIRTRPDGVIVDQLDDGTSVTVVDQVKSDGKLWDFVTIIVRDIPDIGLPLAYKDLPEGWISDDFLHCI